MVKVRALEMWSLSETSLGTPNTVTVGFFGQVSGLVGDQATHTDTGLGVQPAHLLVRPSKRSLAAEFQIGSNAQAFYLNVPIGTVIDVMLTFRSHYGTAGSSGGINVGAVVGAVPGVPYLRSLDGLAIAATALPPIFLDGAI
jgi:hypothetical protein